MKKLTKNQTTLLLDTISRAATHIAWYGTDDYAEKMTAIRKSLTAEFMAVAELQESTSLIRRILRLIWPSAS